MAQGNALWPLLFLIYVNDLVKFSDFLMYFLYADDTSALTTGNIWNSLIENFNQKLVNMFNSFEASQLSTNFSKCNIMIFRRRLKLPREIPVIFMNDAYIEGDSYHSFLGVLIDQNLNFDQHIQFAVSKISKFILILNKIRNYLNHKVLLIIQHTLIYIYIYIYIYILT